MALETYRSRRHFDKTPEPSARKARAKTRGALQRSFVVQKHDARNLHYDFRLELDGVLLSWAVPKGPSLEPGVKRLAMQTEDHPIAYKSFEGVIPAGQYGGGTVLVWDQGHYEPEGDPRRGYRDGRLTFTLFGEKLRGKWHLVRRGDSRGWLLFKSRDAFAAKAGSPALVDSAPDSVLSGRSLDEVASAPERVWKSNREPLETKPQSQKSPKPKKKPAKRRRDEPSELPGARRATLSRELAPELATLVTEVPEGGDWLHEMKFDGYRILVRRQGKSVRCLTRNGKDWTERMPHIARAVAALPLDQAWLDGEACLLEPDGTTNFQRLQNSLNAGTDDQIVYFAFDLLFWNGWDLREVPVLERKAALGSLIEQSTDDRLRLSDHVQGSGPEFFQRACERGLEGVVSKRANSRYVARRTRDWVKVKCARRHEVVIGGFTEPQGARSSFGALLIGTHAEGKQADKLVYRGKVGTGFTEQTLKDLHARLQKLETKAPPFDPPLRGAKARGVNWVKPRLLAEVEYTEVTDEGLLRHPRFKGLRRDKPARDITLEKPMAPPIDLPVTLTHPDRVLYPEQGITKRQLAEYYAAVAEWMLPHVEDRILTVVRCPEGQEGQCFYQKHATKGMPKALGTVPIQEKDKTVEYVTLHDVAGLVSLVQIGVLEIHSWGAHADLPERPDQLVFDLDPGPGVAWSAVVEAARAVRAQLAELDLESFVKLSGGKGLHVVMPIQRRSSWDTAKDFSKAIAERLCRANPERYVCTMSKAKREGRIFIDYLRNARGATSVCPYSTRARGGAPVSVPVFWDELDEKLLPDAFDITQVPARLAEIGKDPWAGYGKVEQAITQKLLRALELPNE